MSTEADIDWDSISDAASRRLTDYRLSTNPIDRRDPMNQHPYWVAVVAHEAAARDMRERCAQVADEWAKQYNSEAADWENDGNTRAICTAIAVRLKGCGREIRALPDTPAVIATSGKDAT